ncbi:hypothetical protein [Echinicola shivajiensis]|uniref:hypothetical protein n=1 Tax=Echinicola shivajiensis TaxID=1035916 RepID=UPI001BFCB2F9|nr:hypothetical protein [Echinicola shivajiensis]
MAALSVREFNINGDTCTFNKDIFNFTYIDNSFNELLDERKIKIIEFKNVTFSREIEIACLKFKNKTIKFISCRFGASLKGDNNIIFIDDNFEFFDINEENSTLFLIKNYYDDIILDNTWNVNELNISIGSDIKTIKITNEVKLFSLSILGSYKDQYFCENIDISNQEIRCFSISNLKTNYFYLPELSLTTLTLVDLTIVNNIDKDLSFRFSDLLDITIQSVHFPNQIFINNFCDNNQSVDFVSIGDSNSKKINIFLKGVNEIRNVYISGDINFFITQCFIHHIKISESFYNKYNLRYYKFSTLEFESFYSYDTFEFQNIDIIGDSKLVITDSRLDNVVFKPSFLHSFKSIEIYNSSIGDIKLIDFKPIISDRIRKKGEIKTLISKKYDFMYNVRNIISIIKGDRRVRFDKVGFLRFLKTYAHKETDINLYHKYKRDEYNEMLFSRKTKFNLMDWFIQFTNYLSNDHSNNPIRSICWIIIILFGYLSFLSNKYGSQEIYSLFIHSPEYFLTPIKFLSSSDIDPKLKSKFRLDGIFLIDYGYKVLFGYLIYQMIAAFRKFNK